MMLWGMLSSVNSVENRSGRAFAAALYFLSPCYVLMHNAVGGVELFIAHFGTVEVSAVPAAGPLSPWQLVFRGRHSQIHRV